MAQPPLDCAGADSGRAECWSDWLNVGVPVLSVLVWLGLMLVLYAVWPNSQADATLHNDNPSSVNTEAGCDLTVLQSEEERSRSTLTLTML